MNVKQKIRDAGLRQWQVAEAVGVDEFSFSRWLRRPEKLAPDRVAKIEEAIEKLSAGDE